MQASSKRTLLEAVETHMTALLREAVVVQRHSKRCKKKRNLTKSTKNTRTDTAADAAVDAAAAVEATDATTLPTQDVWLLPEDIHRVLQWRGADKLYPTITTAETTTSPPPAAVIQLNSFLQNEPSMRPPSEVTMTVHWLAVDGIQPNISMNPRFSPSSAAATAAVTNPGRMTGNTFKKKMNQKQDDDDDDEEEDECKHSTISNPNNNNNNDDMIVVAVQHLLPKLLSEELQLYYQRITNLFLQSSSSQQTLDVYPIHEYTSPSSMSSTHTHTVSSGATSHHHHPKMKRIEGLFIALHALQVDKGIQELIPFFIQFLTHTLIQHRGIHLLQPEYAYRGIRGIMALLFNTHVHLELHLHQILPVIFTCLVIQRMDPYSHYRHVPEIKTKTNTTTTTATAAIMATHYEVRNWAGLCIYSLCQKYSKDYTTIQPRVLKTLVDALTSHLQQQQLQYQQQQQLQCQQQQLQLQQVTLSSTTPTNSAIQSILPFLGLPPIKTVVGSGSTIYGALLGLAYFGSRVIDSFILPIACECWTLWQQQSLSWTYSDWIDLYSSSLILQQQQQQRHDDESSTNNISLSSWKDLYFIQKQELYMCQEALLVSFHYLSSYPYL